jgi:hypothetical protein
VGDRERGRGESIFEFRILIFDWAGSGEIADCGVEGRKMVRIENWELSIENCELGTAKASGRKKI